MLINFCILEIRENFICSELHHNSGYSIELDIFLPNEQLAFEYQGEHHYHDVYFMGYRWQQRQLDKEKKEICFENGITLIEIPYWWDKQLSSLIATIHQQRKDQVFDYNFKEGNPIPMRFEDDFVHQYLKVYNKHFLWRSLPNISSRIESLQ